MNIFKYLVLFTFSVVTVDAYACRYARPSLQRLNSLDVIMRYSKDRKSVLKMIPSKWRQSRGRFIKIREAYAIAFKINSRGQLRYLWSAKGIYPRDIEKRQRFDIYLSNDGTAVAKINPYPSIAISAKGRVIPLGNKAITFYNKGHLSRKYSLTSFITERRMKGHRNTCGNVNWLRYRSTKVSGDYVNFTVVNGKKWKLNLRNGGLAKN